MKACEICGSPAKRRKRCHDCGRMCCDYCGPTDQVNFCVKCSRRHRLWLSGAGRRNDRNHDCMIYSNGLPCYGRIVHAGVPIHERWTFRTGRRGVDPEYVDSQYHGVK